MSRLRNVQGVTRVSLSKSEKSDTAAANGGSSATGGSTVGPCGKGSPPSFEVVVFFEKAAVADALATATGDTRHRFGRRHRRRFDGQRHRAGQRHRQGHRRLGCQGFVHPRRHPRRLIPCLAETRC